MLSFPSLFLCLAISVGVTLFLRQRKVTEYVNDIARRYCQKHQVVFLDGTVQCQKMRWNRSPETGRWRFYRLYIFEYSSDDTERGYGAIVHEGDTVRQINFIDDDSVH